MLDLLQHSTLATQASLLAVGASGALAGVFALGLRLVRRGPARFWLAPAFLSLALAPLAGGAGLSAASLERLAGDLALLGAPGPMAVRAGLAEALLPLLVGALATFGVAGLGLLLLAFGRRREADASAPDALAPAIPAASTALGLLALGVALGVLLAARALSAEAPFAAGLARGLTWTAAPLAIALLAASLPLALGAPRAAAPRRACVLGLCLLACVGAASVFAAGVGAALVGSVMSELKLPSTPTTDVVPPPAEDQAPSTRAEAPARVGSDVREPRKLVHVPPTYPPDALQARVQGTVVLECTIGPDGRVTDVEVKRGSPLLDGAAREAVRQWVYEPTRLDGVPVPVVMTVTVNFRLR